VKKYLIISIFFLSCYHHLLAQAIIPKFGITMNTVNFSEALSAGYDISGKYGTIIGLAVDFPVNKFLDIQPGLFFHEKGWVEKYSSSNFTETGQYRLNYIEVPVMAKVKYKMVYILAGPFGAIGIRGVYRYSREDHGVQSAGHRYVRFNQNKFSPDYEYMDNDFDFGLQGGIGVKIMKRVNLEIRYSQSFANIYQKGTGYTNDNTSRNKGFQLTIGFPSPKD
jgi:hypothetical protein